jgi:hypothetical protein
MKKKQACNKKIFDSTSTTPPPPPPKKNLICPIFEGYVNWIELRLIAFADVEKLADTGLWSSSWGGGGGS